MSRKIELSCNRIREDNKVHSPNGVRELRSAIRYGLRKKYIGIAESMWRYDHTDKRLDDAFIMSENTIPEIYLFQNGNCCWFEDPATDQIHCLPYVNSAKGVNIYGKVVEWSPVPVGTTAELTSTGNESIDRIRNLKLNAENSVLMRNDLFGTGDQDYIYAMIDELVDNTLTMNQLQLIAKAPFVFNVSEDNLLSAKNFFLAMCEDKPAIFVNANGERAIPVLESTNVKIDPALFELFDRFECQILEYLGLECVPITKRAQQSVSEVQSNNDKISLKRQEKLHQREIAVDRINEIFGTDLKVVSVLDEMEEQMQQEMMQQEGEQNGDNDRR